MIPELEKLQKIRKAAMDPAKWETVQRILTTNVQTRAVVAVEKPADGSDSIPMSFSSETPVLRFFGYEVLSHKPGAVLLERANQGLPFCDNHNTDKQTGRIEDFRLANGVTRGAVRFSRSQAGQDMKNDFLDGIRKETSIGYQIYAIRQMKAEEISAELQAMCVSEGCGAFMADEWEPLEASSSPVPADPYVGAGRALEMFSNVLEPSNQLNAQPLASVGDDGARTTSSITTSQRSSTMDNKTPEQLAAEESARVQEIERVARDFESRVPANVDLKTLAKSAIDLRISAELFRGTVFSAITDSAPIENPAIGLSTKEKKQYSFIRLIQSQIPGSGVKADFELECSRAVADKMKRNPEGFFVPYDIQTFKRDLTVGSATAGGNIVGTVLEAGSFIELLRNALVGPSLGVRYLSGLVGSIAIPKQTGGGTFAWVTENNAPSETALTVGQVAMSPKTGSAYMDYSRQLLLQSTPSIDRMVQEDLAQIAAIGVDTALFHGTGLAGQPTGIVGASGVDTSVSGTDFGFDAAVDMESAIRTANVRSMLKYVTNANVAGTLKKRLAALNTSVRLLEKGEMNGYPVIVTNSISSGYLFLGDFSQAIIGEWGSLDILVDPYTGSSAGTVRVTSFVSVDVGVRQGGAFSVVSSLT